MQSTLNRSTNSSKNRPSGVWALALKHGQGKGRQEGNPDRTAGAAANAKQTDLAVPLLPISRSRTQPRHQPSRGTEHQKPPHRPSPSAASIHPSAIGGSARPRRPGPGGRGEHSRTAGARGLGDSSLVFCLFENLTPFSSLSRSRRPCLHPLLALSFLLSHGPHGRRLRPPRHGQARFPRHGVPDPDAGSRQSHPPPRLRLPDAQLGSAPPPPLLQGRRPGVPAAAPADAVAGQGEAAAPAPAPAGLLPRRRVRVAAPAPLEPPHPPLRHRRAARLEIGRRGEGAGGRRAGAAAAAASRVAAAAGGGRAQEEGLLRRAHQGRDRRGLRRHPRHPPAAPAQEAPARRAAPARHAVPGAVSRRRESGLVQDRRAEVIGAVLVVVVQIGGAFQMFPAFPFSVR